MFVWLSDVLEKFFERADFRIRAHNDQVEKALCGVAVLFGWLCTATGFMLVATLLFVTGNGPSGLNENAAVNGYLVFMIFSPLAFWIVGFFSTRIGYRSLVDC